MSVIRHAIYRDYFLSLSRGDPGDVFLEFNATIGFDDACAAGYGEDNVKIDLCVGVGH